ncbi:MAG: hypothetical protein KIT33_15635 [Candidatus Kapabacteria bacterium]|nr:hypothetical protein [Ignavibacteriota bacterium]MCW5886402.1 hypothetical protein [Candidatus Kapabacteria bacterium]
MNNEPVENDTEQNPVMGFRISSKSIERLDKIAEQNLRSRANMALYIIEKYLSKYDEMQRDPFAAAQ